MSEMSDSTGTYVDVRRLEFVVTWRCNSMCKHCSVAEKRGSKSLLRAQLAGRIVRQIADAYSLTSMMTFGGEPLLFWEVVCAAHEAAKDCGIPRRDIITNAGYPPSEPEFRKVAEGLAESGVTHAAVSVDAFHQEHVSVTTVEQNVRLLLDVGISVVWNPCWVVSREQKNRWNERTRKVIDALHLSIPAVAESEGNVVQPSGNALKWLGEYLPTKTMAPEGACEDVPYAGRLDNINSISIEPDGSVMVCNDLSIGNANEQDVVEVLRRYDPCRIPETAAILRGGVAELEEFAWQKGITPEPTGYYSICDKCIDLRSKLAELRRG